jgi:probable HAF family extracellular repeat protein
MSHIQPTISIAVILISIECFSSSFCLAQAPSTFQAYRWNLASGTIQFLGTTSGSGDSSAQAVSGDGAVVVGAHWPSSSASSNARAFRWTSSSDAMIDLGTLPNDWTSYGNAVSNDGSTAVGSSQGGGNPFTRPFRWTASSGTMQNLGALPGQYVNAGARAVSGDGSVVVGVSNSSEGDRGFMWTQAEGIRSLGAINSYSSANSISIDGGVVVGQTGVNGNGHAYRWTSMSNAMQDLGTLPGFTYSNASAVSGDGLTVVGASWTPGSGGRGFYWSVNSGVMGDLGSVGWEYGIYPYGVSNDGTKVVGRIEGNASDEDRAFLWTPTLGLRDLNAYASTLGLDLAGWTLVGAAAISSDGTTVVGTARISAVPEPSTCFSLAAGLAIGYLGLRCRRTSGN